MMADFARFGAIMFLITLGFALAFYAMFGTTSPSLPEDARVPGYESYQMSLLTLFASLLGNFDFQVSRAMRIWHKCGMREVTEPP